MDYAEQRRNVQIAAIEDLGLLELLIKDGETNDTERAMAASMRAQITDVFGDQRSGLSKKQRAWAEELARRVVPITSAGVPRGREVITPPVLRNLPKRPPPSRGPDR